MASKILDKVDDATDVDIGVLVKKFKGFCLDTDLAKKDDSKFTSKACNKLVQETLKPKFGKLDVSQRVDSVFLSCCPKGSKSMPVTGENIKTFIHKSAVTMAKKKTGNDGLSETDPAVAEMEKDIALCISKYTKKKPDTKQSKSGAVDRLTDTSKYTGAHKERFDETGKGKGIKGREERHDNTGYVGAYKDKDTYDKRK